LVATIIIITIVAIIAVGATAGTFVVFPQLPQAIGNIAPFIDDLQIDYPTPEEVQQETLDNKADFMEQLPEIVTPPDLDPMDFENPSEDIPIEEEPNFEEPVTSEDPPITQICDELLLDCGTESVGLLVEITTVDKANSISSIPFWSVIPEVVIDVIPAVIVLLLVSMFRKPFPANGISGSPIFML